MRKQVLLTLLACAIFGASTLCAARAQTAPAAPGLAAPGGGARGAAGRGGRGPQPPPGPPAPVPPEVAAPRPTSDELTRMNADIKQFVATSPDKRGDQYWPKRSVSSAMVFAGIGPNTMASALDPTKRTDRSGSVAGSCIATRRAFASGDLTSTRAARPPSFVATQFNADKLMVAATPGTMRPKPTARALALARRLAVAGAAFCALSAAYSQAEGVARSTRRAGAPLASAIAAGADLATVDVRYSAGGTEVVATRAVCECAAHGANRSSVKKPRTIVVDWRQDMQFSRT